MKELVRLQKDQMLINEVKMYLVGNVLYAEEGKLLDFKEPKYALNDEHELVQVHLYSPKIRLGRMDSADNYIEIRKSEVE